MRNALRLTVAALIAGTATIASAQTASLTDCVPLSIPATITRSGTYCLTQNFRTTLVAARSAAITVNASNVVVDLAGHTIDNRGAGAATQAIGVWAEDRQNITVRNGTLRGFFIAVGTGCSSPPTLECGTSTVSQGHVVESVRAQDSTFSGIDAWGFGTIIRQNQILNTGGTTVIPGLSAAVRLNGSGMRVIDNDIATVTSIAPTPTFGAIGIWFVDSTDVMAVGNRITNSATGIAFRNSTGKYRDNLTSNVATPYVDGTDAGNND
jgi:hypothetical protein